MLEWIPSSVFVFFWAVTLQKCDWSVAMMVQEQHTSMADWDCAIETVCEQNSKLMLKFSQDVSYVTVKSISVFVHWRTFHITFLFAEYWTRIDFQTICDVRNHALPLNIRFSENWAMNVKHIGGLRSLWFFLSSATHSPVYCLRFDYYVSFLCLRLMLTKRCRRLVSPFLWAPFGEGWMHRRGVVFLPSWLTWWSETVSI